MKWQLFVGCFAIAMASFGLGFKVALYLVRVGLKDEVAKAKLKRRKSEEIEQYNKQSWY